MEKTYTLAMLQHVKELNAELNDLTVIALERKLNRFEYRAAERTLQIVIEASIGVAKHWCKQINGVAPVSAYQAFEKLEMHGISQIANTNWKQIIGMRNALVHDYLNIDPVIIEQLIRERHYESVVEFAKLGLGELVKSRPD
ncbi:MAG: hypothetical protein OFPII_25830 [Osedax symbiont Rs1]|nr:MAG: hypothetical protein OFPII_25830 [Osedax symbiont Rs1]